MSVTLWIVAVILVFLGMAGTLLPALPGVPLVFGGLLLGAWVDGFTKVTLTTVIVLGALTVLSLLCKCQAAMWLQSYAFFSVRSTKRLRVTCSYAWYGSSGPVALI